MRVMRRAHYRPENTVYIDIYISGNQAVYQIGISQIGETKLFFVDQLIPRELKLTVSLRLSIAFWASPLFSNVKKAKPFGLPVSRSMMILTEKQKDKVLLSIDLLAEVSYKNPKYSPNPNNTALFQK